MMAVYVVALLNFTDVARYRAYQASFAGIFANSDGEIVAADESPLMAEGDDQIDKLVLMRFPNLQTARDFLEGSDYQRISEDRRAGAITRSWFVRELGAG
jgi:uncharacterized protein (DUF1330 family)